MNTIYRLCLPRTVLCLVVALLLLIKAAPSIADSRHDALKEIESLRTSPAGTSGHSDELKSVEATFAVAEHFSQASDNDQAERFYLLTIQKARIIRANRTAPSASPTPAAAETPGIAAQRPPAPDPVLTEAIPAPQQNASSSSQPTEPPTVEIREPELQPEAVVLDDSTIVSDKLVGTSGSYTVVKGDTLRLVAAKLGVTRQHLIKRNGLDEKAYLKIGQRLTYNNRKIVPQTMKNGIIVNIPDRTMYFFRQGRVAVSLPVALGVPTKTEKYDWQTPIGKFKITAKMKDPTWHVPPSIQSEMEEQGKEVITSVPPGDSNPLGKYAMKTSIPGILIHSTTKPWSIYSFASHGCIRVYPEQMEDFFKEVKVNTSGEIIYKPVKLAVTEDGRVFLEVHRDIYSKTSSLALEARRLIEKQKLADRVDWRKVEVILQRKAGIAEDITL